MIRRPVCYGYRIGEVRAIEVGNVKPFAAVVNDAVPDRTPAAVSLGPTVRYAARPRSDFKDGFSQVFGAAKRVCKEPHARAPETSRRFAYFVQKWVRKNISPLPPSTTLDVDEYLASTSYSGARKSALKEAYEGHNPAVMDRQFREARCFIKDESYGEYKAPRWIMSRPDAFKVRYGPYVWQAEKVLYARDEFVKHLTPTERLVRMQEMDLTGVPKYGTDHTAFEAAITPATMRICEFVLMDHLFQHHEGYRYLRRLENEVIGRPNHLRCSNALIGKVGARMSGDNCTSLGNGFTNLMAILFAAFENKSEVAYCQVEGDDGLYVLTGKASTRGDYARNGFDVKMEVATSSCEAGFCGLVADPVALEAVTDPVKVLLNFGWASRQYTLAGRKTIHALIRSKALSYAYMYPSAPIISTLCKRMLELTRHVTFYQLLKVVKKEKVSEWQRRMTMRAISHEPTFSEPSPLTRNLVFHKYGISVSEQKELERRLQTASLGWLPVPDWFLSHVHPDCLDYYSRFVVEEPHMYGVCPFPDLRTWSERLHCLIHAERVTLYSGTPYVAE